jgi:hypothetical protein
MNEKDGFFELFFFIIIHSESSSNQMIDNKNKFLSENKIPFFVVDPFFMFSSNMKVEIKGKTNCFFCSLKKKLFT